MNVILEIRNQQIKNVRSLSQNVCDELDNCVSTVNPILEINESFRFVNEAFMQLIQWQKTSVDESGMLFYNLHSAEQKIRIFLFEVRSYLDHMETTLKRKYGKNSSEYLCFKAAASDAYDNVPEYPFVYRLRNYSQHCDSIVDCLSRDKNTNQITACAYVSRLKSQNQDNWHNEDINFMDAQSNGKVDLIATLLAEYHALDEIVHTKVMNKLVNDGENGNCIKWLRDFSDMNFGRENAKYFNYADLHYIDGSDATIEDYYAGMSNITFTVKAIDWRAVYQITDSMGLGA